MQTIPACQPSPIDPLFADLWHPLECRYNQRPVVVSLHHGCQYQVDQVRQMVERAMGRYHGWQLHPGQRVVLSGFPSADYLFSLWAAWLSNLITIPVDHTLHQETWHHLLHQLQPHRVLGRGEFSLDLSLCPTSDHPQGGAMLLTSGSTGLAKAIPLPQKNLLASGALMANSFGWQPGDCLLNLIPFHAMSGLRNPALAALQVGATILLPDFPADQWFMAAMQAINRHKATLLVAPPSFLELMLRYSQRWPKDHFATLRLILSTGSLLHYQTAHRLEEHLSVAVRPYYGLTETTGLCALVPPHTPLTEACGVGRAARGATLQVVDDEGTPLPPHQAGELRIGSDLLFNGYWQEESLSRQVLRQGWFYSGDIASICEEGWITLHGRKDDRIKTNHGEMVYPATVENLLLADPIIKEAVVLSYTNLQGEGRLAAFVVLHTSGREEDPLLTIRRKLLEKVAKGAMPDPIIILPVLQPVGQFKVNRNWLRHTYLQDYSSQ